MGKVYLTLNDNEIRCPNCGKELNPVPYYTSIRTGTVQKTVHYFKSDLVYKNIIPKTGAICLHCGLAENIRFCKKALCVLFCGLFLALCGICAIIIFPDTRGVNGHMTIPGLIVLIPTIIGCAMAGISAFALMPNDYNIRKYGSFKKLLIEGSNNALHVPVKEEEQLLSSRADIEILSGIYCYEIKKQNREPDNLTLLSVADYETLSSQQK